MIIDGKNIAQKIYDKIKKKIASDKLNLTLAAVLVGNNSSSLRYINQKKKWAKYVGINFRLEHLDENISQKELLNLINSLNNDESVTGFIVQLPLPKHIDEKMIINSISPAKDVDGFHPENQGKLMIGDKLGFVPCTPAGIMEILKAQKIDYVGKEVVVIGKSNIVGKPITNLLINAQATVISCNSKTANLVKFTREADIIISATGQPNLIGADMVRVGATVIDVGFTVIDGKIYGDADTEVLDRIGVSVTPVPGGVGALTVAMLMKNTLKAGKNV